MNRRSRCSGARRRSRNAPNAPVMIPLDDASAVGAAAVPVAASSAVAMSTSTRSGSDAGASGSRSTVRSSWSRAMGIDRAARGGSADVRDDRTRPASSKRPPVSPSMAADTNPGAASADDDSATPSLNSSGMWRPSSVSNIRSTTRMSGWSSWAASAMFRLSRSLPPVMTIASARSTSASRSVRASNGSPTTSRTSSAPRASAASPEAAMATTCSSRRRSSSIVRRPR